MASVAEPYTEALRRSTAGFADAHDALACGVMDEPDQDSTAFARQSVVTGLDALVKYTNRYAVSPEFRSTFRDDGESATPILRDGAFRRAAGELAEHVEECRDVLGSAASTRIAKTVRALVAECKPEYARTLASQAETAARLVKKGGARK
jgi:hypothetical protein